MPEVNLPSRPNPFPEIKPFDFFRKETQQHEDVHLTEWIWHVQYVDNAGGELYQYDFSDWKFHQFREIDTSRPLIFTMKHAQDMAKPQYRLLFDPITMKLIHFYRNGMLDNLSKFPRLHVFGYEKNIEGKVQKTFMVIMPNGDLVVTDNMDHVHF